MQSTAATPQAYLDELPEDRRATVAQLRKVIRRRLPKGFAETMCYGMIAWVVPHKLYPAGYHCDPTLPLSFISLASQKKYISLYHLGLYADSELLDWFLEEYRQRHGGKLDMGKCCLRFKKPETIPYDLIGDLAAKLTPQDWIALYESRLRR